jgi:hypothetical protein
MDAQIRDERYWKVTIGVTFLALLGTCLALYVQGVFVGLSRTGGSDTGELRNP